MKIRGIVERTYSGSASRSPGKPWMLALELRPWRDTKGNLMKGCAIVWTHANDHEALLAVQSAAPRKGEILEVDVEQPERIPGLDRPGESFEFALVAFRHVVDSELEAFAVEARPKERVEDPVLGAFSLDKELGAYACSRSVASMDWTYELRVTPLELTAPEDDLMRIRDEVAWLEGSLEAIRSDVVSALLPLWIGGWKQAYEADEGDDEENEEDDDDGANRRVLEAAVKLASASFEDTAPEQFSLSFSDGDLFGGHWIEVTIKQRRVVDTALWG